MTVGAFENDNKFFLFSHAMHSQIGWLLLAAAADFPTLLSVGENGARENAWENLQLEESRRTNSQPVCFDLA